MRETPPPQHGATVLVGAGLVILVIVGGKARWWLQWLAVTLLAHSGLLLTQDSTPERGLVDFVGAVVDPRCSFVAIPVGENRVVGDAEGTVDLDGRVDCSEHGAGNDELDRRNLSTCGFGSDGIDLLSCVQCQQKGVSDLGIKLGNPVRHDLPISEAVSLGGDDTLVGARAEQIEGTASDAEPVHAVMNPARTELLLCNCEAGARAAEEVGL